MIARWQDDASGFLGRSSGETLIIDEVQKVPALLDEIKIRVDENDERGQYLLTGSANLRFAKAIRDSLAGRMRTVRLGRLRGRVRNALRRLSIYNLGRPNETLEGR